MMTMIMGRPFKYSSEEERKEARRESIRRWRERNKGKWRAILRAGYERRKARGKGVEVEL
jgi:hypothetical protein